jgi:hypothetical protein
MLSVYSKIIPTENIEEYIHRSLNRVICQMYEKLDINGEINSIHLIVRL